MKLILIFTYLILINSFLINSAHSFNHNKKIILRKNFNKFTILGDIDYRNKDKDDQDLYHRHYDLGIRIPLTKNWSGSFKYRNIYRKSESEWDLFEQRPQLQITNVINYSFLKFRTRIREEYRIRDGDDSFRTRLRFDIKSKKSFLKLKPFIGNEVFYDMGKEKYNKNWLIGGVSFPKSKFGNYSIYYRHVTDLDEDNWSSDYSIVLKAIYEF